MKKRAENRENGDGAALLRTLAAARSSTTAAFVASTAARLSVCAAISSVFAAFCGRFFAENWGSGGICGVWTLWFAANLAVAAVLARRWRRRFPTTARLARRLERRFAGFAGILTAAVEFAEDGDGGDAASDELRTATIRTAIRRTDAIWRELDAAARVGAVWNVDGAKTRRRTAGEFCAAAIFAALAIGIGTVDGGSTAKIANPDKIGKIAETSETAKNPLSALAKKIERERKNDAEKASSVENEKTANKIAAENENSRETAAQLASFADDWARAGSVAANFAADLRRRAESEEPPDDVLLQTAREIESLVDAPGKGLRDRAARLKRSAAAAAQTAQNTETALNNENNENNENAPIAPFVAATTAVRAREIGAALGDETLFGASKTLGAAFRSGDSAEKSRAFDAAARTAARFAETARREKAAWSALAAGWAFANRRREFAARADALFDAARTALTRTPGRSAFELANENGENAQVAQNAASLRTTVGDAFGNFERLRDALTRDDAAEFLAFVERIARRTDATRTDATRTAQTPGGVEKAALDWNAARTAACDEIAATAAAGRFGAAAELAEKTAFGTLDAETIFAQTPENADSDAEKRRRRAALAAARLTFGFANGANDGNRAVSENSARTEIPAISGISAIRGENEIDANAANGGDFAAEPASTDFAENAEPTSFADLRELADATIRALDGDDAVATANRDGGSGSEIVGGNAPDAAFSGGKARPDDAPLPEISAFDAFWNELPNVEKERLNDALKTETPPEFDEKIRLYRRRLFDGF